MSGTAHMRHGLYILIAGRGGAGPGADHDTIYYKRKARKVPFRLQCSKNICV